MFAFLPAYFGISLALMLVILIVAYAVNRAHPKPQWDAWIHEEASAIVINAIYFVALVGIYGALSALASAYLGNPPTDLITLASSKLGNLMDYKLFPAFSDIIHRIHSLEIFSGYSISAIGTPGFQTSTRMGAGLNSVLRPMIVIRDLFPLYITSITFQILTLEAIRYLYDLFLPFGIILRVFPFTREAGNELLAVVLSFTIFLPLLYVILFQATDDVMIAFGEGSIFTPPTAHLEGSIWAMLHGGVGFVVMRYMTLLDVLFSTVNTAAKDFAYIGVISVLIPTFAFMSTISLVRSLMNVFEAKV